MTDTKKEEKEIQLSDSKKAILTSAFTHKYGDKWEMAYMYKWEDEHIKFTQNISEYVKACLWVSRDTLEVYSKSVEIDMYSVNINDFTSNPAKVVRDLVGIGDNNNNEVIKFAQETMIKAMKG